LRSVADALRVQAVVYAEHRGHRGYPIGFAAGMYSDLVSGAPEDNPLRLIARYPAAAVEVDDLAVLGRGAARRGLPPEGPDRAAPKLTSRVAD
jgi:molybdenum cofactor cytidylyltransferase